MALEKTAENPRPTPDGMDGKRLMRENLHFFKRLALRKILDCLDSKMV